MNWRIGTSGYSYSAWKGSFYPEKLPAKGMLSYYAEHFEAVEINGSFRKLPDEETIVAWTKQTPATFRFVLKAPQRITHIRRLQNVEAEVDGLKRCVAQLKRLGGPVLFQLPPNFKKDLARLEAFLKLVGKSLQAAFEFRHETWLDDETYALLRKHRAALVVADAEELPATELVRTADWGYLRLRREKYTDAALKKWVARIAAMKWKDVCVFFKHEDTGTGPKLAKRLSAIVTKE